MHKNFTLSAKIKCVFWVGSSVKATVFCTKSSPPPSSSLIRRLQFVLVEAVTRPLALGRRDRGRERERGAEVLSNCRLLLFAPSQTRSDAERACERRRALSCSALKGRAGGTLPYTNKASSFGSQSPCTLLDKLQFGEEGTFSMTLPFS